MPDPGGGAGGDAVGRVLAPLLASPGRAAVVVDFDGTLAPIVAEPDEARPLPGSVALLSRLASPYARVGIVSGRPLTFLLRHVDPGTGTGISVFGLYGLQRLEGGRVVDHPEAAAWRPAVEAAARSADGLPGVKVERKGLSVAVHFRGAADLAAQVEAWAAEQAELTDLVVVPARMAVELRPPVRVDKGTAVAELIAGLDAACFLGDDVGDLAAFAALEPLGAAGVRVAVTSAESPAELLAEADLQVEGPTGAVALLEQLLPPPLSPGPPP